MKKFFVFALAVLLVFAFTLPAAAIESQFGGYWRTRFATQQNFSGEDFFSSRDVTLVDTRTRIYYTAVFHDNLKFVNKFEFDATWGENQRLSGASLYGDPGSDGVRVEVKNSYADFNMGDWNFKVGVQGFKLARGLLWDEDAAGVIATYNGDNFQLPIFWVKGFEGSTSGINKDNDWDVDFYGIAPVFNINDVQVNPFFVWATSEDMSSWRPAVATNDVNAAAAATATMWLEDMDLFFVGVNLDYKADNFSVWGTFIYENGEIGIPTNGAAVVGNAAVSTLDIDAYLLAGGGSVDLNEIELHGQFVYATGDSVLDQDIDSFTVFNTGQSYYWAEIMGLGAMDNQASAGSPGAKISNIILFNVGTKFSLMDDLSVKLDLWNANLEEDNMSGDDHLGTEVDVTFSYQLVEGLNADFIAAYLFAGDATFKEVPGMANQQQADPWELALRLSLSF